jgi:hypothetical protein
MPRKTKTQNPGNQEVIKACTALSRALGPETRVQGWKDAYYHRPPINTPVLIRYTKKAPSAKLSQRVWHYTLAVLMEDKTPLLPRPIGAPKAVLAYLQHHCHNRRVA